MASALFMDAANGAAVSGEAGIYDVTQALTFLHYAVLLGSSRQPSVQWYHEWIGWRYW